MPDAAVPWNLYALKIAQTQLAMKPILFFSTKPCRLDGICPGKLGGRGNDNCFFTRFVVKRLAYGAKRIGAGCGHPRKLERLGRDFSIARGVFRSPERPENESASRGRRDAARASACES